ncbi:MAG: peptidyl-prolyl cis-trans isomerase [Rhodobacteraceae bacterium]|nr:peptidyl-prolyl cis-trans isomerase [Paracoccaceae bacterium]
MASGSSSLSKTAVWALLGLLILALGGFGATNLSGTLRTIGSVGSKSIGIQDYANGLQQELRVTSQQLGRNVTFREAQSLGVDQRVIRRLLNARALDHEAEIMGLSIGDERLAELVRSNPAFVGVDGSFERESYRFSLERAGLSEAEFEQQLREENARAILQAAVVTGVVMPETYVDTLIAFIGETRDFTWVSLDRNDLAAPLPEPDDATLKAYYEANIGDYELPESKRITYAVLLPEQVMEQVEISEDELRAEYEARSEIYNQPERRLVERLVYLDASAADQAAAQLDVGGTTFEALVDDRGLALSDIDMGDVSRLELDAAGEAVFNAEVGDVVGPLPSALGPALFRVNGILPAQSISLEQATPELRVALASDRARRLVDVQAQDFDDLLAGGATLEDLVAETDMELGTIDWFPALGEGIAAYDGFAAVAEALTENDFPQIENLDEGGVFAARLEEILPPRPAPFEEAVLNVRGNWDSQETETRLIAQAEAMLARLQNGEDFDALGTEFSEETNISRSAFLAGTPPDFLRDIFAMEPGDIQMVSGFGRVHIVRLNDINPASEDPEVAETKTQLETEISGSLALELFGVYGADTTLRAGIRLDQRAIDAVNVNFP